MCIMQTSMIMLLDKFHHYVDLYDGKNNNIFALL